MSKLYEKLIRPAMFAANAETAHELGLESLRIGLSSALLRKMTAKRFGVDANSKLERFGLSFGNPLGVAAGFDKNGVVVEQLAALGFAFVEAGTVTFDPQPGNPKPRMFRLPDDEALINRLGFNNKGAAALVKRLENTSADCIVGVNIGKNKDVPIEEATENYLKSFEIVHPVADYVAVNISSPNTPNLREMQKAENLEELLNSLQTRNKELTAKPLLVKIAPDLSDAEIEAIVDICLKFKIDGIIATNTTVDRAGLKTSKEKLENFGAGGLSGKPVTLLSNRVISRIFTLSKGKLPVIGVGGIFSGLDAFDKIAAGACLLQAYTGFIYRGPSFARDVNLELDKLIAEKGFSNLDEAIGSSI